jgi:hypothetical protein
VGLFEWLEAVQRGVILGGPGLGKSAALRFLALDLLSDQPRAEPLARRWGNYLPIFVPFALLTRLVADQEVVSVVDCLRGWLRKLSAPSQTVALLEKALDDERLLLLVDGLDEWSDSTAASTALVKLLDFTLPRGLPVIASARPPGYARLGGLGPDWKKAELLNFDSERQRQFTKGWFEHFYEATLPSGSSPEAVSSAAARDTESFMAEVEQDSALSELAGVPLLLSVLIYLRLQGRVLPRNRFGALEAFTTALIHEQPQRRAQASLQGAGAQRQNPRLAERGIQFLALLVHQHPGSESVPEDQARAALAGFYSGSEFRKPESEAIELAATQVDRATQEVGILVQRQPGQVGFLHRSLQEFLAAKELARWPFERIKTFVIEKSAEPGWQEVLLAVLHLIGRQDEVDSILNQVCRTTSDPLDLPLRKIFLARAVFADLNCSAKLADEIAEDIFSLIERSAWMPLRVTLVTEAVQGLDSEILGPRVRDRLKKWFPGRVKWRWGLFQRLAEKPSEGTNHRLLVALFNSDGDSEMKEIAEAIAIGASAWPEVGDALVTVVTQSAEADLLATTLHALALGWPHHAQLSHILIEASDSRAGLLRAVALIHRTRRGDTSDEVKRRLVEFCSRENRIYWPWQDDLVEALKTGWPGDTELRATALRSARKQIMPTEWNEGIALKYLVRAFPGDDDVAGILADVLRTEESLWGKFGDTAGWDSILAGFKGHPTIVPAAEDWLQKYKAERYEENHFAQVAMLARTQKCRQMLIDRLKGGKLAPQWLFHALVDLGGADDPSALEVMHSFMTKPNRIASVAHYLPKLRKDHDECRKELLALLETADGIAAGSVVDGLDEIDCLGCAEAIAIIDRRLRADSNGTFWWIAKHRLLAKFPQNPLVRRAALTELNEEEPALPILASVYANDPEFRPYFDALTEPLHEDLRLVLVRSLRGFTLRHDAFARDLLAAYTREWNAQVRTAAAHAFYAASRKMDAQHETHVSQLHKEMMTTGPGYDARRQAAFVGLLAMGKPEALLDPVLKKEGTDEPIFTSYSGSEQNWEFIRAITESWESLQQACGDHLWKMFRGWDVLVWQLAQAGKRNQSFSVPANLIAEVRRQAHMDKDAFLALAVLEEGQQSFRDFCLSLFLKTRMQKGMYSVAWGYNEVQVWFEAARYLAIHYAGEPELGARLEEIARESQDPSGPIIALCRGWPGSKPIEGIWASSSGTPFSSTPTIAWVVNARANAKQVAGYVQSLPAALENETWWKLPRETVRAMQQRLARDRDAQLAILESTRTSTDADIVGSVSRLLGTVVQDRQALRAWARDHLSALHRENKLQPMGYDMLSGTVRPVEFCLLESCLAS